MATSDGPPRKRSKWDPDDTPVPQTTSVDDLPEWLQDLASAQLQGKSTDGIGPPPPGSEPPPMPSGPPPGLPPGFTVTGPGAANIPVAYAYRDLPAASPGSQFNGQLTGLPVIMTGQEYKRIQVPASIVGALIGKGGEGITKLRTASQADIKLHHGEGEPFGIITISGNLAVAEKIVKDRIEEINRTRNPDHFETAYVEVPKELVGQVIGASGCNIQIMQNKSGCKIGFVNIMEVDHTATEDRQVCRIKGPADKILQAKELVLDQVDAVKQFRKKKKEDDYVGSTVAGADPRSIALKALEAGKAGKGSKARLIANAAKRWGLDPDGKGCGGSMSTPASNAPPPSSDGSFRWPELEGGASSSLLGNGMAGLGKGKWPWF